MFVVDYGRRMSALSHRLASSQNAARIAAARRMHYTFLANSLADTPGFNPVFSHLPANVCPLVLPVWVTHRERLLAALQASGIEPFIFGEYAHPAMTSGDEPITPHLRAHILGLPVHQLLTAPELEKISSTLHPLLRHHALEPLGTPAHV
jgi:dTDP-4-amino-4,6-dideoxygalactose transaminase